MNAPGELPPAPTVAYAAVTVAHCSHCDAVTVQVNGGSGLEADGTPSACLQCIADGGTCCSLKPLNRWAQ